VMTYKFFVQNKTQTPQSQPIRVGKQT
jgi:hypothetical protein